MRGGRCCAAAAKCAAKSAAICAAMLGLASCHSVDDTRIPAYAVNITISDTGMWNTYGVTGYGMWRRFILGDGVREPYGFPYSQQNATGYGGVLLISGMDPFTTQTGVPLAYDLSCPVEMKADVRVEVEDELYQAVCPVCGSRYDVTMGGGNPLSGPAATGTVKYGLRRYSCYPTALGGYVITN